MSEADDQRVLDEAFDGLERESPGAVTRFIRWVRHPKSRWVRIPLGLLFIASSFFWFLPVVGIEFFPIGLLLIAQDVPILKRPVGKLLLWLEDKWVSLRQRRRREKS